MLSNDTSINWLSSLNITVIKVTLLMIFAHKWSQWFVQQPWVFTFLYRSDSLYHKYSSWMFFVTFFICSVCWRTLFKVFYHLFRISILDFLFVFLVNLDFVLHDQLRCNWFLPIHLIIDWYFARVLLSLHKDFNFFTFFYQISFIMDFFFIILNFFLCWQISLRIRLKHYTLVTEFVISINWVHFSHYVNDFEHLIYKDSIHSNCDWH